MAQTNISPVLHTFTLSIVQFSAAQQQNHVNVCGPSAVPWKVATSTTSNQAASSACLGSNSLCSTLSNLATKVTSQLAALQLVIVMRA